jgi:hypothetical protein
LPSMPTEVALMSQSGYCSLWSCSNTSCAVSVPVLSRNSSDPWHSANATTHAGSEPQVLSPAGEVNQIYRLRRAAPCAVKQDCRTCASCGTKKRRTQNPPYSPIEGSGALASARKSCLERQFVVYYRRSRGYTSDSGELVISAAKAGH